MQISTIRLISELSQNYFFINRSAYMFSILYRPDESNPNTIHINTRGVWELQSGSRCWGYVLSQGA